MSKKFQAIIWAVIMVGGTLYGFVEFIKCGDKTAPAAGVVIAGLLTLFVLCYKILSGRLILWNWTTIE